jgi:hypothetical protein
MMNRIARKLLLKCFWLNVAVAAALAASPCDGVDRSLRNDGKAGLAPAIGRQLKYKHVNAQAQPNVWEQVNPNFNRLRLQSATLTKVQQRGLARLILQCCKGSFEEGSTLADLVQRLIFQKIPLASKQNVLLISDEDTEGTWGTGGGGAMWLVRLGGDVPILLASPEDDFNGWLYSIQPSVTHGYHDLVLGWHMSAGETILTYFQFDGRSYVSVSTAANLCDQNGCRIDPRVKR